MLKSAEITFSNGSKMRAVPGKPDTVRGTSANIALTEFDFFERPEETWRAILPSITEQTRQSEGGLRTTWTFQGVNGNGKSVTFKDRSNSLDYGFEPGFSQVSIQRHPNFMALLKKYGGYPDNDGQRVLWPTSIEKANGGSGLSSDSNTSTNPMFGVNEFFQMEGTYRFRYASQTLPGKILASSGTICTGLPGQPPPLVEGRNWLMLPIQYRRRGTIFDITEQYWLSGRGGWPEPVYGKSSDTGL